MVTELRLRNQSQRLFVHGLSNAWRNNVQLWDPSVWLVRDPEAEEKMLRDADIYQAVSYRMSLIAGHRWALTPRVERSQRSAMAVMVGEELLKSIRKFTEARRNLARAFFSGSRFGTIHGHAKKLNLGDGETRTWWVPTRIEDEDKRLYRIVPHRDGMSQKLTGAHWERWDVGLTKFLPQTVRDATCTIRHVYNDDQATLGHGRALRESLGWWWYAKQHVFQHSLASAERYGEGWVHVKVDGIRDAASGLPNSDLISNWVTAVEEMMSRNVLVSDKNDEISILDPSGQGWQTLTTLREELRNTITSLVLNANLPTTGDTKGGSFALAKTQENSTEALIQFDRESLEETLSDDLVSCVWKMNAPNMAELGIANEMPRFTIAQEKREDPQVRVQVATQLSAMGVELGLDDLLEQTGFAKPEPGEETVKPQPQQQPQQSPFGFSKSMGFGTFDESQVKRDKGKFAPKEGAGAAEDDAGRSKVPRGWVEAPEVENSGLGEGVPAPRWFASRGQERTADGGVTSAEILTPTFHEFELPYLPGGHGDSTLRSLPQSQAQEMTSNLISAAREINPKLGDHVQFFSQRGSESAPKKWASHGALSSALNAFAGFVDSRGDGKHDHSGAGADGIVKNSPTATYRALSAAHGNGPAQFARPFDESKVKRDAGKFAPKEGAGAAGDEPPTDTDSSAEQPTGADSPLPEGVTDEASAMARADQEMAGLPQDVQDYLNGKAPIDRQPVSPEEKAEADQAVGNLADVISGAEAAPAGSVGSLFAGKLQATASAAVKIITNPANLLKLAIGAGVMPAAAAFNVVKAYSGMVMTAVNLVRKKREGGGDETVASNVTADERAVGDKIIDYAADLAGKIGDGAKSAWDSMKADIKSRPVVGTISALGTAVIAIPMPFSLDAGLAIKGASKVMSAFSPQEASRGIGESIKKAFFKRFTQEKNGQLVMF